MSTSKHLDNQRRYSPWILGLYDYSTRLFSYIGSTYQNFIRPLAYPSRTESRDRVTVLEHDHNARLAALWTTSDKPNVVFITMAVQTSDDSPDQITGIGHSIWCLDGGSKPSSYYWHISDELPTDYLSSGPGGFLHGPTQSIHTEDIGHAMNDLFHHLISRYRLVCVVGHGIDSTLKPLHGFWSVPEGTAILDTQRLWQEQNNSLDEIALEDSAEEVIQSKERTPTLGNAGNRARATLKLLQAQGVVSVNQIFGTRNSL